MSGDLKDGIESSDGDPKLALVMNAVLSALFTYTVLWLSEVVGIVTFTLERFVFLTLVVMLLTFLVIRE